MDAGQWIVVTLVMGGPAMACSFNATGLGEGGEPGATQGPGTGAMTGTGTSAGAVTEAVTEANEGTTQGSAGSGSGTSGGAMPGSETSSGTEVGATTQEPEATTMTMETTGEASSGSGEGESSTGCVAQDYYFDGDGDQHGDPEKVMTVCGPAPAGYVAVGDDCEDGDPAVYPGRDEVCDQKDNDCDALTDEFSPTNGDCDDCKMIYNGATKHLYHFCSKQLSWEAASAACVARGATLARDSDIVEHVWLVSQLPMESGAWYIGAWAPKGDDKFVWQSGGNINKFDPRWGVGRPMGGGGTDYLSLVSLGLNNAMMLGGSSSLWHDLAQADQTSFICEGDPP